MNNEKCRGCGCTIRRQEGEALGDFKSRVYCDNACSRTTEWRSPGDEDRKCKACKKVLERGSREVRQSWKTRKYCLPGCGNTCAVCGTEIVRTEHETLAKAARRKHCSNACKAAALVGRATWKRREKVRAAIAEGAASTEPGDYENASPITISARQVARDAKYHDYEKRADGRPETRGDCKGGERPCVFVTCKHNLYLSVGQGGSIRLHFPDIGPGDMKDSCALDLADDGGATLTGIAKRTNVTRERIRQIEATALAKLRGAASRGGDIGDWDE